MSRKRTAFIYIALIVVVVIVTTTLVGRSEVTRQLVANRLDQVFAPDRLEFGDASFDLSSGVLSVEDLRLDTAKNPEGELRSSAERIELQIELNPLRDTGSLRHVRIERANLHLDLFNGRLPDFTSLFPESGRATEPVTEIDVARAPSVECVDSQLTLKFDPNAPPLQFEGLRLRFAPVRDAAGEFGLEGQGRGPGGALTELSGGIAFVDGELRQMQLRVTLSDLPVTPDSLQASSPPGFAKSLPETLELDLEQLQIFASYEADESGSEAWDVRGFVNVRDGRIEFEDFSRPIERCSGRVSFGLLPERHCDLDLEAVFQNAALNVRGTIAGAEEFDLEANLDGVPVDDDLQAAIEEVPVLAANWNAFKPSGGRASLHARARRGGEGDLVRARLDLDHVSGTYLGVPDSKTGRPTTPFPVPVNAVTGPVLFEDGRLSIDHLELEADEGVVYFDGEIVDDEILLRFTGEDVAFSDRILDALYQVGESVDTEVGEYYERLEPEGRSDVVVIIDNDAESDWFGVTLRPTGTSLRWNEFPVRIENVGGLVEINSDGLRIDANAERDGATLKLEVDKQYAWTGGRTNVFFEGQGLQADEELLEALEVALPDVAAELKQRDLRGRTDIELSAWAEREEDEVEFDLRLDLFDGSLALDDYGLKVRDIEGPLFIRGSGDIERIDLGGLRADVLAALEGSGDATVDESIATAWVQGVLGPPDSDTLDDVAAVIRDLELDDRVRSVLARAEILEESVWDTVAPSGTVDMVWRRDMTASPPTENHVRLQLREASVGMALLPRPVDELVGSVTVVDDRVELSELSGFSRVIGADGSVERIPVHCDRGLIEPRIDAESGRPRTVIELDLRTDGFPLDDRLANALEGPMGSTYLSRGVRGRIDLDPLRVGFHLDAETSETIRTEAAGEVRLHDVAVDFGTPIEDFSTRILLERGETDAEAGLLRGTIDRTALTVFGKRMSNGSGRFLLDEDALSLFGFEAELFGGRVRARSSDPSRPTLQVGLTGSAGTLATDLRFDGMRLDSIVTDRRGGIRGRVVAGDLGGTLRVSKFDPENPIATEASGAIRITEGDLGEVPVLNAFYENFKPNRRPRFNEASLDFRLADRILDLDNLELDASQIVSLTGSGQIGLDGYVDVKLRPSFLGDGTEILVVPSLVDSLVAIQLYGQLRGLQSTLLFGGGSGVARPPLGPIPPR